MFYSASAFNQDIGGWAVHSVTDRGRMFHHAEAFDQDISGWKVYSVKWMGSMFGSASSFNQDLGWCVDADVDLGNAFDSTPCESTSCGVLNMAALQCGGTITDSNISYAFRCTKIKDFRC